MKQQMILKTIKTDKTVEDDSSAIQKERTQIFRENGVQCRYRNHIKSEDQGPSSNSNKISISNNICKNNGQAFEKVTIIRFNNQIVTIKDQYSFISHDLIQEQKVNTRKVQLFKKPNNTHDGYSKKRVTKNLAKNFIKAFMNYLEQVRTQENSSVIECKMKILTSKLKYNNSLIQRIIDDEELENFFLDFLRNHAKEWIMHSKIRQKKVHLEAIEIFLRLSENRQKNNRRRTNLNQNTPEISLQMSLKEYSERKQQQEESPNQRNQSNIANSRRSQISSD